MREYYCFKEYNIGLPLKNLLEQALVYLMFI